MDNVWFLNYLIREGEIKQDYYYYYYFVVMIIYSICIYYFIVTFVYCFDLKYFYLFYIFYFIYFGSSWYSIWKQWLFSKMIAVSHDYQVLLI